MLTFLQLVVAAVAVVVAAAGVADLAGARAPTPAQRAVREVGTPARRRAARAVVAARGPVDPAQVNLVAAVAAVMLERRTGARTHASMIMFCLSQVFLASSWALVGLAAAGVANAVLALVMADRWLCARRFLADHADLRTGVAR